MHTLWLFFGWPSGGVWSNMIAWVLGVIIGGVCGWTFKERLGRRLAAWFHRHHLPHLVDLLDGHIDGVLNGHAEVLASHAGAVAGHAENLGAVVGSLVAAVEANTEHVATLAETVKTLVPARRGARKPAAKGESG